MDGLMLCTRESDPWKEVKSGRIFKIFKGIDCFHPNTTNTCLCHSQYVAHSGKSRDFGEKLQSEIDAYGDLKNRPVFLSDGAARIREWIADHYPLSITILDFYHTKEHLYHLSLTLFFL